MNVREKTSFLGKLISFKGGSHAQIILFMVNFSISSVTRSPCAPCWEHSVRGIGHLSLIVVRLRGHKQKKRIIMSFIFLCLCLLGVTAKLNSTISKTVYSVPVIHSENWLRVSSPDHQAPRSVPPHSQMKCKASGDGKAFHSRWVRIPCER